MLDDVGRCWDGLATLSNKITFAQGQKGKSSTLRFVLVGELRMRLTKDRKENSVYEPRQPTSNKEDNEIMCFCLIMFSNNPLSCLHFIYFLLLLRLTMLLLSLLL